eukprot:5984186-Lingulodinium_polyedra.AAC.1
MQAGKRAASAAPSEPEAPRSAVATAEAEAEQKSWKDGNVEAEAPGRAQPKGASGKGRLQILLEAMVERL